MAPAAWGSHQRILGSEKDTVAGQDVVVGLPFFPDQSAFYYGEVGRFKSQALAERLSKLYGRAVGWLVVPFGHSYRRYQPSETRRSSLVIGCVDNAQARQGIAEHLNTNQWWVDAGNGESWGQVLIGNAWPERLRGCFSTSEAGVCYKLPLPTVQHPALLSPPPAEELQPLSCAELMDTGDQDPTINQAMASLVLQVVRRLLRGDCPWMALYLKLHQGTLNPVLATPQNVSRITRIRAARLVGR